MRAMYLPAVWSYYFSRCFVQYAADNQSYRYGQNVLSQLSLRHVALTLKRDVSRPANRSCDPLASPQRR